MSKTTELDYASVLILIGTNKNKLGNYGLESNLPRSKKKKMTKSKISLKLKNFTNLFKS